MLKIIYILLLTLSASASIIGNTSYIAIIILIILNLSYKKQNKTNIITAISLTIYFLILLLISLFNFNLDELDLSNINIYIQMLLLITFPRKYEFYLLIKKSLSLQLLFSFLLCVYGLLFNDYSMFIDGLYTKGYENILIPKGIYSTPQTLASVGLIVLFLNKDKIYKTLGFFSILISLNRTSYVVFFLTCLIKSKRKLLFSFIILPLLLLIIYSYNLDEYINFRTIDSRINLLFGAYSQLNIENILPIILGSWKKIEFYLPMYDIYKNYIENGYLFIFNSFGIIGIVIYLTSGWLVLLKLLRTKNNEIIFLFLTYYFITPIMTHEYLTSSFYQIIFIFYFYKNTITGEIKNEETI